MSWRDPYPQELFELGSDFISIDIVDAYLYITDQSTGQVIARVHVTDIEVPE